MRRAMPLALVLVVPTLLAYGVARLERPQAATTTSVDPTVMPAMTTDGHPDRVEPLARIDANIAFYRARGEISHSWLDWNFVAINYMDRARLTGDYADWREADAALGHAFTGPNGFGPYLTRAALNSAMHRIDRVEADLDAAGAGTIVSRTDRAQILAMRADARYYGGLYADARALYEQQVEQNHRDVESLVLLAQLDWHTGRTDEARHLLDEARTSAERPGPTSAVLLAWVLTTQASMERDLGQLDDALTSIRRARMLVPDDAHTQELEAEIHELRGEDDEALHDFRAVAARTSSPQSLDGAARVLRARGDMIAADELVTTARQTYEAQIALFPEAAYGHAIDHWLWLEPDDVDRMITIAEGNALARPYGDTQVKLAVAYLLTGRPQDARATLDAVLATEWDTAQLHAVNALAQRLEGTDGEGEEAIAEAMAPGISRRLAFGSTGPN